MLTVALNSVHAVSLLSALDRRLDQSWKQSRARYDARRPSAPGLSLATKVAPILNEEDMEGLESCARMPQAVHHVEIKPMAEVLPCISTRWLPALNPARHNWV